MTSDEMAGEELSKLKTMPSNCSFSFTIISLALYPKTNELSHLQVVNLLSENHSVQSEQCKPAFVITFAASSFHFDLKNPSGPEEQEVSKKLPIEIKTKKTLFNSDWLVFGNN